MDKRCEQYLMLAVSEYGISLGLNDQMLLRAYWNNWKHKLTRDSFINACRKYVNGTLNFMQEPG